MQKNVIILIILLYLVSATGCGGSADSAGADNSPPYQGTVWINPGIITTGDVSSFQSLTAAGNGDREMFDRRTGSFSIVKGVFLFNALYDAGVMVEVQVNPEFETIEQAETQARLYADAIGRMPSVLFGELDTVWIHKGLYPFGGGNNNILIHTDQGEQYIENGFLEEVLVHEGAHTSLDPFHANAKGWIDAQALDNRFISDYARDNPRREDVAETFLVFLAVEYLSDRLTANQEKSIREAVPNRLNYFRQANLDMFPYN